MAGVTIELHDYDLEWPRLYERGASRIADALGGRVIRLEHFGSTSVPSLVAKPMVDIVLAVDDSSDADHGPGLRRRQVGVRGGHPLQRAGRGRQGS